MNKKIVYFIGIKGVAMTALAVYLKEMGYSVIGSDVNDVFATDRILKNEGIKILPGFSTKNINKSYDLVVVTGAHGGMTNPEAIFAKKIGLRTIMHGQALGEFMSRKVGISVAGCHGKTTTSSMIASLLIHSGLDPSYAVGTASITDIGNPGHFGKGNYFVVESDEYVTCPLTDHTPRFLWQHPKFAVLTNIEFDHPDVYKSIDDVLIAYEKFIEQVHKDGMLVACIDNPYVKKLIKVTKKPTVTYGFSPQADFQITNFSFSEGLSFMRVKHKKVDLGDFALHVPGKHNALNALAASIVANCIGQSWSSIRDKVKMYQGSQRRFQKIAQVDNILLYDDYAHHPSEIKATLSAIKEWFPDKKLVVIFQPHTFSRTKSLLNDFGSSFVLANHVLIPDIYPSAREAFDTSITSNTLVEKINKVKKNATYMKNFETIRAWLETNINGNELIVTMGAGDIFTWHPELIKLLSNLKKNV